MRKTTTFPIQQQAAADFKFDDKFWSKKVAPLRISMKIARAMHNERRFRLNPEKLKKWKAIHAKLSAQIEKNNWLLIVMAPSPWGRKANLSFQREIFERACNVSSMSKVQDPALKLMDAPAVSGLRQMFSYLESEASLKPDQIFVENPPAPAEEPANG